MTHTFIVKNLKELTSALKNPAYAPYYRRLQAILDLSFKTVEDVTGYVPQTVENQVGFKNKAFRISQDLSDK